MYALHAEDTSGLSNPERERERESNGERERQTEQERCTLQSGCEDFITAHAVYCGIRSTL